MQGVPFSWIVLCWLKSVQSPCSLHLYLIQMEKFKEDPLSQETIGIGGKIPDSESAHQDEILALPLTSVCDLRSLNLFDLSWLQFSPLEN